MTDKNAVIVSRNIIKKLYDQDIEAIAFLMTEEAENKTEFLKYRIIELKQILEQALEEIERNETRS